MTGDTPAPFELATCELRKLGIALRQLSGEYSVNFINAGEASARILETLDEALEAGRRPRRMTPKAHNKRLRLAHMRKLRARAIREQRAARPSHDDDKSQ